MSAGTVVLRPEEWEALKRAGAISLDERPPTRFRLRKPCAQPWSIGAYVCPVSGSFKGAPPEPPPFLRVLDAHRMLHPECYADLAA